MTLSCLWSERVEQQQQRYMVTVLFGPPGKRVAMMWLRHHRLLAAILPVMATRNADINAIEQSLGLLLRRSRRFRSSAAHQVHPDIEPEAYGLLVRIDDLGSARPSDLASYFGVGRPTITRQLSTLERLGLVERRPHETDARSTLVALTADGAERFRAVRSAGKDRFRDALANWTDDELNDLAVSLSRLNERVNWE